VERQYIDFVTKGGTLMANPSLIRRLTVTKTTNRVLPQRKTLQSARHHMEQRNQLAISGHSGCKVLIFNSIVAQCRGEAFQ